MPQRAAIVPAGEGRCQMQGAVVLDERRAVDECEKSAICNSKMEYSAPGMQRWFEASTQEQPMSKPAFFRLRPSLTLATCVISLALAAAAGADDWPQWQGPDRNSISKETGLLKEWPKDGPRLAWKVKGVGGGFSAPSIAAGQIFGMSNRGDDEV